MSYHKMIETYIENEIKVLQSLDINAINEVLKLLEKTLHAEGTIYIFGNGGSAATASHFQNDFNKGISLNTEKKFRFLCLNDNVATLMAIANDNGFDNVFSAQLEGRLQENDIIFAISGSGNSRNVLNAVEYARRCGNQVVGITGYDGGKLKELSDFSLHAPVDSMQITEDIHMIFDHLMMSVFYKTMCNVEHLRG